MIKTTRIVSSIVVSAVLANVGSAMDLVVATDDKNRSVLQATLALQTNNQWSVSAYDGSDLDMVDDIRQRAVTSSLPNAAQIPGATIRRWAALGFINNLQETAVNDQWNTRLPETIRQDIAFRDEAFAVPTQIHRSNWMWLNRAALENEDKVLPAPRTWSAFFDLLDKNAQGRSSRIITVDDPSQNTLILEAMMLGLNGPEFYRQVFKEFDYKLLKSQQMVDVFTRFAQLRPHINKARYETWEAATKALVDGQGQILFAGDWVKPMFTDADGNLPDQIVCEPYPEASATFLYNLNSVVMFKETTVASTGNMAHLLFTENVLTDLNLREGSIPARLDISPWGFDRCAVRAMREFRSAHTINTLQPSLAAGMAAPEGVQKSVYKIVNEFILDDSITPEQGAKNLAKAIRVALYKI
jgi:glucose/mannose transport system substrate-binding protein